MPKNRGQAMRRKLAQVNNHIDIALEVLQGMHAVFEPTHPQHAEMLMLIGQSLLVSQKMVEEFWVHTWGKLPKSMERWRY